MRKTIAMAALAISLVAHTSAETVALGTSASDSSVKPLAPVVDTGIPYDAEVEYLRSNGNQYIDTGIYLEATDSIDMGLVNTSNEASSWSRGIGFCCVSVNDWYNCDLMIRANPGHQGALYINAPRYNRSVVAFDLQGIYGEYEHLHLESGNSSLGSSSSDKKWGGSGLLPCDVSIVLFARHYTTSAGVVTINTVYCSDSKVRTFSITRGGEKIVDMLAVRIGAVGYMYDRVTGVLFRSQGSQDFLLGPDLPKE